MKIKYKKITNCLLKYTLVGVFLFAGMLSHAQSSLPIKTGSIITGDKDGFLGNHTGFIENIGQYGEKLAGFTSMGNILYGYEGFGMPVLFTKKGLIHLQRKTKTPSPEEIVREERREKRRGEGREKPLSVDKKITMEWVNANPNPEIVFMEEAPAYHTYGMLTRKAKAYGKLIYKDLYPGIDLEYSFLENQGAGFEYKLLVKPGADVNVVKMRYGGDIQKLSTDKEGNIIIRSSIEGIMQSGLAGFFDDSTNKNETIKLSFLRNKNTIGFKMPADYNKQRSIVIDPFISSTGTLAGSNSRAKDIDFDYAGNVYVSGGGDFSVQKLAKFDPAGVLQWTFTGILAAPVWRFGDAYGGWVVEKTSGAVYLGQGLAGSGFSVIRLTTAGVYDNYITTSNSSFGENWKMLYSCRTGIGTILIAGGGGSANNELALLSPPSVIPTTSNISGLSGGHNDISDIIMDPLSNEMYTIFSTSVLTTAADNIIYKHVPPYSVASLAWSVPTGLFALKEPNNRPYMNGLDNSSNTLAINSNYLFYWDGKTLKAINKATGATVGTPLTTPQVVLQQGGIFADECDNIFVGSSNGVIKAYKFNGADFDDAAAADLVITGFPSSAVYDLAYDNGKQLLYASGDGFVASFALSAHCPSTIYAVQMDIDCAALSATATVIPDPPIGTSINYVIYDGTTVVASNSTGIFTGLTLGINYTVKAFLNQACGGTQATGNFVLTTVPVVVTNSPPTICIPLTADLTAAAITAGSSAALTFSYWQNAAGTIPLATPTAASAGTYFIKGTALSGCATTSPVTIVTFPVPVAVTGNDATICFGNSTQLNGTGGVLYSWTPTTYLDNPSIANPMVINPGTGSITYNLKVTDINGCESQVNGRTKITVTPPALLSIVRDTVVAIGQPLQLNVIDVNNSGFTSYQWSPSYGLNDPLIPNPIAILDRDITYTINSSTAANCQGAAVIHVKVYKGPEIYVPSAFTPGKDGLNDILRAIPVGIKEFRYFSIYNRNGGLVFTTSDPRKGWDGKIQGVAQSSGVFVWMAKAIDYNGNIIERKGICTIIR